MKSAILIKPKTFELTESDITNPKENEILIKVNRAGVCGSDLHFYLHGKIGSVTLQEPFRMGHEFGGVVADTNGHADAPAVGTRVAVDPAVPCGQCIYCQQGRSNICPQVKFTGFPPYKGAYAEYIPMPLECVFPVPDCIPDEQVPVIETLAVAVHGLELAPDVRGKTCALIGAGSVGMLVLLLLLQRGAIVALVTEPVPERRQKVKELGCPNVCGPNDKEAVRELLNQHCPYGPELIFEAAGEPESFQQCFDLLAPGGKIYLYGIYAQGKALLDFNYIRRQEGEVYFVRRSLPKNYPESIALLESGAINIAPLVTHQFPIEQINDAFVMASNREQGIVKAVLKI